ncbi:MAG: YlxR family protein [Myxococcales bacterium]|nr:YlxR family protein [Myxococcales bacterium]
MRTCIACRERHPRSELLRFTLDAETGVQLDSAAVRPGRGAWVCPTWACFERAASRGGFSRAFRKEVRTPPVRDAGDAVRATLESTLSALNSRLQVRRPDAPIALADDHLLSTRGASARPSLDPPAHTPSGAPLGQTSGATAPERHPGRLRTRIERVQTLLGRFVMRPADGAQKGTRRAGVG